MKKEMATEAVTISPPNFQTAVFKIKGNAPYVQNKLSQKAKNIIHDNQAAGAQNKKGKAKEPKDFAACYEGACHRMDGAFGIPAPAFRCALISACRPAQFKMTHSKLGVFVIADGFDDDDGMPLVKITKGEPIYTELAVRNESGVLDLRARPMWKVGWEATLRIRFDADMFSTKDLANLLVRAGIQVGIGEGRPDSKKSAGMGWGTFDVA